MEDAANAANPAGFSPGHMGLSHVITGGAFAAVSADESRAAEIGRDILQSGGNATDAATAMYFALAVTLPSAAGLGASGACIVQDDKTKAAEAFVFAPIAAPGTVNGQPFSVPSGVRGVMLMHIRHGKLRWEQTVAPAERLARFGVPVSRALSRDLQAGASLLGNDRETRRIFGKGSGGIVTEGDVWTQGDLAGTLGAIRQRGGGEFFQGALARRFTVLDHYFSSVLGSTWLNREYLNAATAMGKKRHVRPINQGEAKQETIWQRLAAAGVPARSYYYDLPTLVYFGKERMKPFIASGDRYFEEAARGQLPNVVFIDPGFRIALHHKDLGIVTAAAREAGVVTPLGAVVTQLMASAMANGDGGLDHSGLLLGVERLSGIDGGQAK